MMMTLKGAVARPARHSALTGPFDLHLRSGEHVAILGPSGAGKSTLLKLLSGELPPHLGQVDMQGMALSLMPPAQLAQQRAVLPQGHGVAFGLPVELVVSLGRTARWHDPLLDGIVVSALALAQAGHLKDRRFDTLSGGEQARVQMARVFAQAWDTREGLLLVDEPLSALDPGLQFELMDALQGFARTRQHALVAVLHDINQALHGFERLWLVRQGRLVGDWPVGPQVINPLADLYGVDLHPVDIPGQGWAVVASRATTPCPPHEHQVIPLRPSATAQGQPPQEHQDVPGQDQHAQHSSTGRAQAR